MWTRRTLVKTGAACAGLAVAGARARFAYAATADDRRLIVVILRGGLDGLAAVPAIGDSGYTSVRGSLALPQSGDGAPIALDGFFGLHPALKKLGEMWRARELAIFHNVSTPYRDRSHFDAQNVLESGGTGPHRLGDGWLNRALGPLGLDTGSGALAVASSPPLLLTGAAQVTSWQPSLMPGADEEFIARVAQLYEADPVLGTALRQGLATRATAEAAIHDDGSPGMTVAAPGNARPDGPRNAAIAPLMEGAGRILAADESPRVAVFDVSGWDTHSNQGAADGQLARRLQALDEGLSALKTALGPLWGRTAIVAATEFGRTAAVNGTGGTDHGTAGAVLLLGGAVAGGTVHAEWTGLKPGSLQDGRDLPPRTDMRAIFKSALADHLGVPAGVLDSDVFPDSASAPSIRGLFRA